MINYLCLIVGSIFVTIGGFIGYYIGLCKGISISRELTNFIENDFIEGIKKNINNE